MPIIRDAQKPQHSLSDFHYGSLPVEGLPAGPADELAVLFWDGTQWQFAALTGLAGIGISWDQANKIVEVYREDERIVSPLVADSILLKVEITNASADAVLV